MGKVLPLTGLKVVELATVVAAPVVGRIMANFGAEVIKIETPPAGDLLRPYALGQSLPADVGNSPLFDLINSGKKLTAVNLKSEEGMAALERMLASADVFTSNIRMRSLKKMGLDYETLRKKFPRLVYAHISGFGLKGADSDRPGFDATTFWFRTGGSVDMNVPGSIPLHPSFGFGDMATASALLSGIMMAIYARNTTGEGSQVSTSLLGSGIWCNAASILSAQPQYGRQFPADRYMPWDPFSDYYECRDGEWIAIIEKRYETDRPKFAKVFDMPELETDPDCHDLMIMRKSGKIPVITKKLEDRMKTRDCCEWQRVLDEIDIPNERAAHFKDMWRSEQAWENGCFEMVEYPDGARTAMPLPPIEFSEYGRVPVRRQGGVGSDTREVFASVGYSETEIDQLMEKHVIM